MASEDDNVEPASARAQAGVQDGAPTEELDEQTRARRDAALAHVRQLGDPVLRASAVEIDRFDGALGREIERMGELMVDALGIGLAATQLGVLNRALVYRVGAEDPIIAMVNPVIEWRSEETEAAAEGCLSIPGVHVEVERPARIRARAQDPSGRAFTVEAEGLEARVIQHEVDHLDGILILDRISREARLEAMRALREAREGGGEESVGGGGSAGGRKDAAGGEGGSERAEQAQPAGEPEPEPEPEPERERVRLPVSQTGRV